MNRVLATRLATLHFAATDGAARNLRAEGVSDSAITVTGQTGIDALLYVRDRLMAGTLSGRDWSALPNGRQLIVVTAHRRESFGAPFERICLALAALARRPEVTIVFPVHPNPAVREPVRRLLGDAANVILIEPLDYVPFVDLMRRADIIITDSGGIQEEGPSLGKPILVMRETTERPEALDSGTVQLVGTDPERICAAAAALLDNPAERARMSRIHNAFGDGHASERISDVISTFLGQ
jgi:UDP-N-acetylglucosamine 2-epimerase (non-hydrolysing)